MTGRDLPPGWVETTVGEVIADTRNGLSKRSGSEGTATNVLRLADLREGDFLGDDPRQIPLSEQELARYRLREGDLVFTRVNGSTANVGRAFIFDRSEPWAFCDHFIQARTNSDLADNRFVKVFFDAPETRQAIEDRFVSSAGQKTVSQTSLLGAALPLPPLPEQRRIVERIEALTARSRRAKEALSALPALLDRYRQSVLAAAFRGDLTADWRAENGADATAYRGELATLRRRSTAEHGRTKPAVRLNENLVCPTIPPGWTWISLDEALAGIFAGKSFRCVERPPEEDETGLVKISAVTWGEFNETESKTVTDQTRLDERARIRPGDFLLSRANTMELVGTCVIVKTVSRTLFLSDKVLRLEFVEDALKAWVLHWLRSPTGRDHLEKSSSGNQLSMRNISQGSLRAIPVPLPPREEALEIVRRLERQLHRATLQERVASNLLPRLALLDQSILAKAFRGELVPQDPADEPAETLLARIRAERAAAGPPSPRRGRRARATP